MGDDIEARRAIAFLQKRVDVLEKRIDAAGLLPIPQGSPMPSVEKTSGASSCPDSEATSTTPARVPEEAGTNVIAMRRDCAHDWERYGDIRQCRKCSLGTNEGSDSSGPAVGTEIVAWLLGLEGCLRSVISGRAPSTGEERETMRRRSGIYEGIADDIKRKWPALFTRVEECDACLLMGGRHDPACRIANNKPAGQSSGDPKVKP